MERMASPSLKSAELRSKFKVPTPKDVVRKILLSGEITAVYTEIAKLSGFGDGAVKEVKTNRNRWAYSDDVFLLETSGYPSICFLFNA